MSTNKKIAVVLLIALILSVGLQGVAFAKPNGDVAGAIEDTWADASEQVKQVVDHVVFPVVDCILGISFIVKLAMAYFDYKKHGTFEWAGPAILFACLIFTFTAPSYIWKVIGI